MHASIGTISHGTLKTEDLLTAFADALEKLVKNDPEMTGEGSLALRMVSIKDARHLVQLSEELGDAWDGNHEEMALDTLDSLREWLDQYAPPYCYFGTTEGDGSDFGFWPSMESVNEAVQDGELTRVNDPSEVTPEGECVFVNDHGNVTLYVNGAAVWDVV